MSEPTDHNWFHRMQRGEVDPPPVSTLLGEHIIAVDLEHGCLELEFTAPAAFNNPSGNVQGGMLGAMLDALCAGVVDATLLPGQAPVTLSLQLQFLATARPGVLRGQSHITKRGREICFVSATLHQGPTAIAAAQAVCKILTHSSKA